MNCSKGLSEKGATAVSAVSNAGSTPHGSQSRGAQLRAFRTASKGCRAVAGRGPARPAFIGRAAVRRLRGGSAAAAVLLVAAFSLAASAAEPQQLTADGARKISPAFADGGESVVFSTHDEPNRVSLVRLRLADGSRERVDATLAAHQFDADVTADGRYLCFVLTYTSPQSILVIRDLRDGTEARFLPTDARATVRGPRFTPDAQQVVFTLSDNGGQQIAAVDIAGANLRKLTESAGTNAWPAISPDGRLVAFSSSRGGSFNLYLMNVDGSEVRRLTDHPLRDVRPAWSPDGTQIAFASARDGNLEIYVMRADGSDVRRLTDHPDRDDYPVWHPDGRRLLVISERDGNSDLYLLDVGESP